MNARGGRRPVASPRERSERSDARHGVVLPLAVAQRREEPVVDGQQVELGEPRKEAGVGSVAAGHGEFVEEPRHAHVGGGVAAATGTLREGAGQLAR
jgi:hypothetical protein